MYDPSSLSSETPLAADALRESEARFRAIFTGAPSGIALVDLQGRVIEANPALQQMLGYAEEELRGMSFARVTHPDDVARDWALLREMTDGDRNSASLEKRYVRKDGQIVWAQLTVSLIRDEAGRPQFAVGMVQDITALKRAEAALSLLAEAGALLASTLDYESTLEQVAGLTVPVLADWCMVDLLQPDGTFLRAAVAHADPTKADVARRLRRTYAARPGLSIGVSRVLATGEPELVTDMSDETLRTVARDTEHLSVLRAMGGTSYLSVPLEARGQTLGAVTLVTAESGRRFHPEDLTLVREFARQAALALDNARLYREAQDALQLHRAAEESLTALVEASGSLLASVELEAVLESILALARRVLDADAYAIWRPDPQTGDWAIVSSVGLSEEFIGRLTPTGRLTVDGPLIVEDVREHAFPRERQSALAGEGIRSLIAAPLTLQGSLSGTVAFYYRERHRASPGEVRLAMAVANLAASAMTTAELYSEVRRGSEAKDAWLAMLAHELRNPLGATRSALHVLQMPQADEAHRERALEVLGRQIRHQTRLVDDLLDVSRLVRGRVDLRPEVLDLTRLVRAAVEDSRPGMEAGGLRLSAELPRQPLWVSADPTRLSQVVGNLLTNAAKFTDPGGSVAVRVGRDSTMQRAAVIVRDTGTGIPGDVLPHIFEPFVQADRTLDRSRGGLGLGLALVKGLTELHGGEVRVSSAGVGRGAEFMLLFPLVEAPAGAMDGEPDAAESGALRVLIVEDNRDAADSLKDLLELSGHEVEVAYSGPVALERAQELQPDVVLCDIGLPGMDGYEIARRLRADFKFQISDLRSTDSEAGSEPRDLKSEISNPKSLVLVALTGYGQEEDRAQAREAGFDHHLVKPADPEELQRLLSTIAVRRSGQPVS